MIMLLAIPPFGYFGFCPETFALRGFSLSLLIFI